MRADGAVVPYEGPNGIEALLGALGARGFVALTEAGHPIGLSRGGDRITVEPGGQVELSGAALPTAAACAAVVRAHVSEVRDAAARVRNSLHRHRRASLRDHRTRYRGCPSPATPSCAGISPSRAGRAASRTT